MHEPLFDVVMEVEFRLLATEDGGRSTPILSGYRPNCIVKSASGEEVIIGLCVLELGQPAQPGSSGRGRLLFGASISELVRTLFKEGTEFALSEARQVVATARVITVTSMR